MLLKSTLSVLSIHVDMFSFPYIFHFLNEIKAQSTHLLFRNHSSRDRILIYEYPYDPVTSD